MKTLGIFVGLGILFIDSLYIKINDKNIRQNRPLKFMCTWSFVAGLLILILGIIYAIIA